MLAGQGFWATTISGSLPENLYNGTSAYVVAITVILKDLI